MNRNRCLELAQRIDMKLQHALGEGIEPERMLKDALYARDVLLVCDAMVDSGLPKLASLYRSAHALPQTRGVAAAGAPREPLRIGDLLNSIFGPLTEAPVEDAPGPPAARRWFGLLPAKDTSARPDFRASAAKDRANSDKV